MKGSATERIVDRLDLFNARDLTASQVADGFVQPQAFAKITIPANTLIMGPRGSGKTTLLKMLTPEGTERRSLDISNASVPDFGGLFVPIDVQLSDQLETLSLAGMEQEFTEAGIRTLYAFHAFRCIAKSFSWHCPSAQRHSASRMLTVSEEADAIERLAELWQVEVAVPTSGALQQALRVRQMKVVAQWNRQVLRHRSDQALDVDAVAIVDLDTGLKGAVEIIGSICKWQSGQRWAVLFDEVEVAPEALQRHLLSYLRHSDTDILFKVAIAPYMQSYRGLPARSRGSALNDYGVVDLQSASDKEVTEFSAAFFAKAASLRFGSSMDIPAALGPSVLSGAPSRDARQSYGAGSAQAARMRSLARKDPTFAAYLRKKGLSPEDLLKDADSDGRAPIRKVRQVAFVREAYLRDSGKPARRIRSQVSPGRIYVGAAGIINMCEGNPRRLAFITPMLLSGIGPYGRIPFSVQIDAASRTEAAFRSFLRGLPVSEHIGRNMPRGLLTFVDMVGAAFHQELLGSAFPEDPVSSFTVDSNADAHVEELVARGVNSGALVQLSTSDSRGIQRGTASSDPISSSRGKRFRLSYLLSPGYGLTQRVGRSISLSTLMQRLPDGSQRPEPKRDVNSQVGLW